MLVGIIDTRLASITKVYGKWYTSNLLRSQLLLQEVFEKNWIQLYRVRPSKFDKQKKVFTQSGKFGLTAYEISDTPIAPDALRNRSLHTISLLSAVGDAPLLPHPLLSILSADKFQQATVFRQRMPRTVLLAEFLSLKSVQNLFTDRIVLKHRYWSGWKDISLVDKSDIINNKEIYKLKRKEYVVQEYIDFSGWIPDLAVGIHDFRIVVLGGEKKYVEIREPKDKNEFRSNVALWWHMALYDIDIIPPALHEILDTMISLVTKICGESMFCSFDFGYANDTWYLIEINSSPWIEFDEHDLERQKQVYQDLAEYFLALQL